MSWRNEMGDDKHDADAPSSARDADCGWRAGLRRRDFLRLSVLAPLAAFAARLDAASPAPDRRPVRLPDSRAHRFELSARQFLLDGEPFTIRSGEMHPIRIPRGYWRHRVRMAKAMGLNTISLYLMWNALESEPGVFDLSTGRRDFARFIRICAEEGMWVYLRPGPYICGEWDFGGLPPYLLRHPHIHVRGKDDSDYMAAVHRYIEAIASVVRPLMAVNGGPIVMLQIENEYASFGRDVAYLEGLRSLWQQDGIDGPFSISDGLDQVRKAHTYLPGAALGLDGDTDFTAAQDIAGEMPVWMGEGYPGWLTHWGDKAFAHGDFVPTLRKLLDESRSFNLYVVHGGTNFGFGAGANAHDDYSHFQPVITSYDYGAPIDERGVATPDYYTFRAMLAAHAKGPLPEVPAPPPTVAFAPVTPAAFASLWDNLPQAKRVGRPRGNELLLGQDHGMVLYRRSIRAGGELEINGVRDYALIFRNGRYVDHVARARHPSLHTNPRIALGADGEASILDILVDSFGHVGYGHAMTDRKGIVGDVQLGGAALRNWDVFGLPLDDAWLANLKPLRDRPARSCVFFKAMVQLERTGDCYLDMVNWNKGYL
ncbi:MAG: beta-galactosidase, partial [Rhodanobacteraceae bacterium]